MSLVLEAFNSQLEAIRERFGLIESRIDVLANNLKDLESEKIATYFLEDDNSVVDIKEEFDSIRDILDRLKEEKGVGLKSTLYRSKYADSNYQAGDSVVCVGLIDPEQFRRASKHSVYSHSYQVHLQHDDFKFINHSCDPNTIFMDNKSTASYDFVAIKPIKEGDEITFNYTHNEPEISSPFDCECGAYNCIGRVE